MGQCVVKGRIEWLWTLTYFALGVESGSRTFPPPSRPLPLCPTFSHFVPPFSAAASATPFRCGCWLQHVCEYCT